MKKSVSIIGGGPAALTLAAFLDPKKFDVSIYEKNKATGRKFLVAGDGGFNLTHSEPLAQFIERYTPSLFLKEALNTFTNSDTRDWMKDLGIPTFIGSSKRVYPEKGIKPIEVLKTILKDLETKGVTIHYNHTWNGWKNDATLLFNSDKEITSDIVVFALGGGSWKVTGSDGSWLDNFKQKGIKTIPFQASNCAFEVNWDSSFITTHEGKPLKNIAVSCNNSTQKGELVITHFGLEGNAIYALSPQIRDMLSQSEEATITIDLKPTLSVIEIEKKLKNSRSKKISESLKNDLKLSSSQIGLLKTTTTKESFLDLPSLSKIIKAVPLTIVGTAPLDEAISTKGGIALDAVSDQFELKQLPSTYCIGEMLDWDAPTGGYLLQACFSMGAQLAKTLNKI